MKILNKITRNISIINRLKQTEYLFVILITTCLFIANQAAKGQSLRLAKDSIFDKSIRTLLLFQQGWELSMPVYYYKEGQSIQLEFDDLSSNSNTYGYFLTACNYDWSINQMAESYYLDGFNDVPLYDARQSINTTEDYVHISALVPANDLKILQSGNYILTAFSNGDHENVIFTRRFCATERLVDIDLQTRWPDEENQELSLIIDLKNLDLINPLSEIKVVLLKNNDWNNVLKIKGSPLLRNNKIYFDLPFQIVTAGGNEFRYFSTKLTKVVSERIDVIDYRSPRYHFFLKHDKIRQFQSYFSQEDLNGLFMVDVPDAINKHEEASYVEVHFTLELAQPFGTDVYIYGALTNWQTDETNFMVYNIEKGIYEKTLLLKQGFYNYAYVTRDYNQNKINFDLTEGNHCETENNYSVFVYLRRTNSDFDRLIGYKLVNSLVVKDSK